MIAIVIRTLYVDICPNKNLNNKQNYNELHPLKIDGECTFVVWLEIAYYPGNTLEYAKVLMRSHFQMKCE